MKNLLFLLLCAVFLGFVNDKNSVESNYIFDPVTPDTITVMNTNVGSGSKIMTDQDALIIIPPDSSELISIELYYSSISTINSDSTRLYIKSDRSYSCGNLGNAHPIVSDTFTLAITKNRFAQIGWNKYDLSTPLPTTGDTLFIWPDLLQQIQPRVVYAIGNEANIANLNGIYCGNPGSGISLLDYACKLTFLKENTNCLSFVEVTSADTTCYAADTIISTAVFTQNQQYLFRSKDQVELNSPFEVSGLAGLTIDMSGCD